MHMTKMNSNIAQPKVRSDLLVAVVRRPLMTLAWSEFLSQMTNLFEEGKT
jgi:hypothetical protein